MMLKLGREKQFIDFASSRPHIMCVKGSPCARIFVPVSWSVPRADGDELC